MRKIGANPEFYVLVAATGLSAFISVLDFFGLLESIPWLATRIPTLVLLLVSAVLGYLVVERRNKLDAIESLIRTGNRETLSIVGTGVDRIINALKGVDVRFFERREDFLIYLEQRVKIAQRSIDVTHFGLSSPSSETILGQRYYDTFSKVVKQGKVKVRRIVIVRDQAQFQWVCQMLEEFSKFSGHSFFLGCYTPPSYYIRMLNMIIIDREEVFIAGGERIPSYDVKTIWVKHSDFTNVIQEHFDVLWRDSIRLNEMGVRQNLLNQLESAVQKSLERQEGVTQQDHTQVQGAAQQALPADRAPLGG
jgi:hypothetical protein